MDSTTPEWSPQSVEKKSKTLKLVMMIAVAVVLLAGAVVYYFYIYKPNAGTPINNASQSTTGDWSAYSNGIYGYSLEYPKKWQVDENDVADIKFNRQITGDATLNITSPLMFKVKTATAEKTLNVNDWVAKEFSGKVINSSAYNIGNNSGISVTTVNEDKTQSMEIFLIASEVQYRLTQGQATKADFLKIAESFKLIEKQVAVTPNNSTKTQSDLTQTYTNEKYGILFKYPENWQAKDRVSSDSKTLLWEGFASSADTSVDLFDIKVSSLSLSSELSAYKKNIADSKITSESAIKIGDYSGTKIISVKNDVQQTAYLVKRDQYTYIIEGQSENPNSTTTLYFSQMIQSINFLKI